MHTISESFQQQAANRPNAENIFSLPPQLNSKQVVALFSNFTYEISGKPVLTTGLLNLFREKGFVRPNIETSGNETKWFNHEMLLKIMLIVDIIKTHRNENEKMGYPHSKISLAIRTFATANSNNRVERPMGEQIAKRRIELIKILEKLVSMVDSDIFFALPKDLPEVLDDEEDTELYDPNLAEQ
ncbi:MAG: hypothetical protein ABIM99_05610 [Candidatus Dojkabacteria bacterium]